MHNHANIFTPPINIPKGTRHYWSGLHGSSQSLAILQSAKHNTKPTLVLVANNLQTYRIEQELKFFNDDTQLAILSFPDWETLPYDHFSPHQDIISERLATLFRLNSLSHGIIICTISTAMHQLIAADYLIRTTFLLKKGDKLELDLFRHKLETAGYHCVSQVIEHGEFAIRGSILDLYPMGCQHPFRIDLFSQEVDSIRSFDPETQRSSQTVDEIRLLPAREFPFTETAITHFRQSWRSQFAGNPAQCPVYADVSQGAYPQGIEYYASLFSEKMATLFDYIHPDSLIIFHEDIIPAAEKFWQEINERYEQLRYDVSRPLLPPHKVFVSTTDTFAKIRNYAQVQINQKDLTNATGKIQFVSQMPPSLTVNHKAAEPLATLSSYLENHSSRILFCAETAGRREILLELLQRAHILPEIVEDWQTFIHSDYRLAISVAPLETGMSLPDSAIELIAESQLFGEQVLQKRRRKTKNFDEDAIVRNLTELHIGEPIVHIDHGVGRYLGLQKISVSSDVENEFLTLEYADEAKLYIPVADLHLISRYSGVDVEHAPINKLGSQQWSKAKRKAAEKIRDAAAELLDIYALREARQGYQYKMPDEQYQAFAASFPFEETPDQLQAIEQTIADLTSSRPTDRLICGDVGFGKTEVALRAAFIAVQSGKQVAVLVPTTLLAQQHYATFKDRFADWPFLIEVLSRFRTQKQHNEVLTKLKAGKVDIVIGTHKLLQKDIAFNELGLLIIDEEHRFGVRQKEKLKALRAEVDILTLTATPIPRTLNLAMASTRDLSIIATPPSRRLSVKTFVRPYNKALIREAVMREIMRGGQVFFLHNTVETIQRRAAEIEELIPEARVSIGHGQMRERELERIMTDFYHNRFNVLVCTTIVENGIDIPTANTIIIERADRFGLAQLHQLRGRVGRSHHQAYAYLFTSGEKAITKDAEKRLDAIASLEDLGAGFTLATHDLEIRGAGELLGDEQSGHIQAIGYSLYMELLERAVASLKAGKEPSLTRNPQLNTEIDLKLSALIPDDYIYDVHTRLTLYKRIANAKYIHELDELQVEIIDRFGLLPIQVKNLFKVTQLKLRLQKLGICKLEANQQGGQIEFIEQTNIEPRKIIDLVQNRSEEYQLSGPQRLRFKLQSQTAEQRFAVVTEVLEQLV